MKNMITAMVLTLGLGAIGCGGEISPTEEQGGYSESMVGQSQEAITGTGWCMVTYNPILKKWKENGKCINYENVCYPPTALSGCTVGLVASVMNNIACVDTMQQRSIDSHTCTY